MRVRFLVTPGFDVSALRVTQPTGRRRGKTLRVKPEIGGRLGRIKLEKPLRRGKRAQRAGEQ